MRLQGVCSKRHYLPIWQFGAKSKAKKKGGVDSCFAFHGLESNLGERVQRPHEFFRAAVPASERLSLAQSKTVLDSTF